MVKVRKATLKDCTILVEMAKLPELKTPSGYYPSLEWFKVIVKEKQILLVAEDKKKLIGFVMGERIAGDWSILHLMAVDPTWQGKGIGKILIQEFEKECIKRKLGGVILYGYQHNEKTIDFFVKAGYNKGSPVIEFNKHLGKRLGH